MEVEAFGVITEFAVALAGFSGVAIALSHEGGTLAPIDRFRTLNLLSCALGAAFASTFPLLAASFGLQAEGIWVWSSVGLALILVSVTAIALGLWGSLPAADRAALSRALWVLCIGGNSAVVLVQVANVIPRFGPSAPGPLLAGLLWLLFFSALLFVRLLVHRPSASTD